MKNQFFFDGKSWEALEDHKTSDEDWKFCESYFDVDIQSAVSFLQEKGICETTQKFSIFNNNVNADNIVHNNPQLFFEKGGYHIEKDSFYSECSIDRDATIKSEEVKEVLRKTIEYLKDNEIQYINYFNKMIVPVDENLSLSFLAIDIYQRLLRASVLSLECGQNIITNSRLLNELLNHYYSPDKKHNKNINTGYVKTNLVRLLLPNLCQLEFEDILDIRTKAADELGELRLYVDEFLNSIPTKILDGMSQIDIDNEIKLRLTPRITRFENALKSFKRNLISHGIASIGSIGGYSELISNHIFTDDRVAGITTLATIGISVIENVSYYEAKRNEIKNNPLYFSLKLR